MVILGLSIGASFLYIFANFFLKDFVQDKFLNKFQNLEKKLRSFSKTYLEGFLSHEKYINFLSDGVCLLDIFSRSFERKIAISTRSFETINLGVPLIHPKWSELSDHIFEYKNGWVYENESTLLQRIIALDKNPSSLLEASANSVKAKNNLFNYSRSCNEMGQCFDSLGVKHNLQKKENSHFNINKKAKPKVLWLTPSKIGDPLSQLRVESVLSSLFCTNEVSGYMVVGSDRSIFCGENLDYFDSVVLQREGSLVQEVLEEIKTDHYLLDVDDLLIAQASYRKEDHLNWKERFYIQFLSNLECATNVSVTSKRLDTLLKKYSNNLGNYNTCIVNNGLYFKNLSFDKMSSPRAILWTSSDIAALESSRFDVVSAINDFSIKKNIPVYCFGKFPNDTNLTVKL